jgi:hypothetical protein
LLEAGEWQKEDADTAQIKASSHRGRQSVFFRVLEKWKRGMQTRISRPGARRMRRGCRLISD